MDLVGRPCSGGPGAHPDLHGNDDPGWAGDGERIAPDFDCRLVLDNLLALTREQFLHADSLANGELSDASPDVEHDDEDPVTLTRRMHGIEASPLLAVQLKRKTPGPPGPGPRLADRPPHWARHDHHRRRSRPRRHGSTRGRPQRRHQRPCPRHGHAHGPGACHCFRAFTRDHHLADQGLTNLLRQNAPAPSARTPPR
ncbi:hypothetical protein [Streptomyces sp. NPDC091217]|uniref:hypothetical protein n=1 Tax=Streptomyces sp. NPDC091217 TaxID=3365975 RepID=UPI0038223CAF